MSAESVSHLMAQGLRVEPPGGVGPKSVVLVTWIPRHRYRASSRGRSSAEVNFHSHAWNFIRR